MRSIVNGAWFGRPEQAVEESEMNVTSTRIPVEHLTAVHEIPMETASTREPDSLTLLELIEAVSEVSDSEQEVIATVTYMLRSGRVRLAGRFRDTPVARLCS